jgi:hypothetical protein
MLRCLSPLMQHRQCLFSTRPHPFRYLIVAMAKGASPTETTMLTLGEQTTLLLYRGALSADGVQVTDTFYRYGRSGSLVCAAVLMDLALRGRVRMKHAQSPQQRAKGQGCLFVLVSLAAFLLAMFGPILLTFTWPIVPIFLWILLSIMLCPLIIAVGKIHEHVVAGKLLLVDATPVGDDLLDATMKRMARVGWQARIKTYMRSAFTASRLLRDLARLRDRLEQIGCVERSEERSERFGFLEVSQVNRAHPAFSAIGTHMRAVLLEGRVPDAAAVALALLFSGPGTVGAQRSNGRCELRGLYQFFASEEIPAVRRSLAQITEGDRMIAAQVGSDLYDTLIAIRQELEVVRSDANGGFG